MLFSLFTSIRSGNRLLAVGQTFYSLWGAMSDSIIPMVTTECRKLQENAFYFMHVFHRVDLLYPLKAAIDLPSYAQY